MIKVCSLLCSRDHSLFPSSRDGSYLFTKLDMALFSEAFPPSLVVGRDLKW